MEQRVLAIHNKSLKRKRDESDFSEESLSPLSNVAQHDADSENYDQGDVKTPGACLDGTVATKFRDLDIQCASSTNAKIQQKPPEGGYVQPQRPENAQKPHALDASTNAPTTSTKKSRSNEDINKVNIADFTKGSSSSTGQIHSDIADCSLPGSPPPQCSETSDTENYEESLTWDDSEITGHHATDPNDDGYGLNGVGFKPSAEVAWARSQHRKDQVAKWERRQANEAREARSRRRQRNDGGSPAITIAKSAPKQKKVKFDA
ncbi:hypothetical protein MferCBS31731_006427 [Microsporum ferrugineum]